MCHVTFALLFKYEQGLIVFITRSNIFSKCKIPFTLSSVLNKPQAEGRVNHVCTVERRRRLNTLQQ